MIEDELPEQRLDITFSLIDENNRLLVIEPHGDKYIEICERVV